MGLASSCLATPSPSRETARQHGSTPHSLGLGGGKEEGGLTPDSHSPEAVHGASAQALARMGLRGHCWPQGSLGSSVSSWVAVPEPRLLYRKRWGRESWAGRSEPSPGPSSKGLRVCVCKWSMVRWVQEMTLEREAGSEHHSRGPGPCSWVPGAVTRTSCLASSPQTVLRIVVLGIWDYIENKIEVRSSAHPQSQLPQMPGAVTVPSVLGWELVLGCCPHSQCRGLRRAVGGRLRKCPAKGRLVPSEVLQTSRLFLVPSQSFQVF